MEEGKETGMDGGGGRTELRKEKRKVKERVDGIKSEEAEIKTNSKAKKRGGEVGYGTRWGVVIVGSGARSELE